MRLLAPISAATIAVLLSSTAGAQPGKEDPEFLKSSPTVGEMFPDLTVYSADGKEFKTSSLRGHYTVVAFGCLT